MSDTTTAIVVYYFPDTESRRLDYTTTETPEEAVDFAVNLVPEHATVLRTDIRQGGQIHA